MNEGKTGGLAPFEELTAMSGIEALRGLIEGQFPPPPMAVTLNFRLSDVAEGRALFVGKPRFDFYNPLGTVHGGWAATILDSALGCAVHTTLRPGEAYTTVEFKVNLVRPITEATDELFCEGLIVHRGGRIATSEATLKDAAGKLYAHGSETCIIFAAKKPAQYGGGPS